MPGDYTRLSYDPADDFSRPRVQQGRVLLDADLNELADAADHRLRALALDVLGPCTAPLDVDASPSPAATGFEILPATGPGGSGGSFTIGLGRLYVHGLELDNHGSPPAHVERGLQDLRGAKPVPYELQPYYPSPPPLPTSGVHLVYVDAWEREITAVQDPALTDPGVGVDTAARIRTVWQVKVLPDDASSIDCSTPDEQVPGWAAVTAPSAGRLSTVAVSVPSSDDQCSVPDTGGYRGWDNRLYRVEVHKGGPIGQATFKWARDNASVAATVTGVDTNRKVLTVSRTGRDDVQRIRENSWVEIQDEAHELNGQPGILVRVSSVDRVDDPTQQVTLANALDPRFDLNSVTWIRQWDQSGPDVQADGTLQVAGATSGFVLEEGIQITFSDDPSGGTLRTGDYWTFTARSANASLQILDKAPPQGPKHFYGRLALIDLSKGAVTNCRTIWPPLGGGGGCGDCTVCVTPESHASGQLTIQDAVSKVESAGGRVCLAVGRYDLTAPVVVRSGRSVTISGHGWHTVLMRLGQGPALELLDCEGVTVSDLTIVTRAPGGTTSGQPDPSSGIVVATGAGIEITRCAVADYLLLIQWQKLVGGMIGRLFGRGGPPNFGDKAAGDGSALGLALHGTIIGLEVSDCAFLTESGLAPLYTFAGGPAAGLPTDGTYLWLVGFRLSSSVMYASSTGLFLDYGVYLSLGAEIRNCVIMGGQESAVYWKPQSMELSGKEGPVEAVSTFRDSRFDGFGAAVLLACSHSEITGCQISGRGLQQTAAPNDGVGVLLTEANHKGFIQDVRVSACRILAQGAGIVLDGIQQDIVISDNLVDGLEGGVVMLPSSGGARIVVRDNDVRSTTGNWPNGRDPQQVVAGIWLAQADGEVRGNRIHDLELDREPALVGILTEHCPRVTVAANTVDVQATPDRVAQAIYAVAVVSQAGYTDVVDNVIFCGLVPQDSYQSMYTLVGIYMSSGQTLRGGAAELGTGRYITLADQVIRVVPGLVSALPGVSDASGVGMVAGTVLRGNRIEAGGPSSVVDVTVGGSVKFSDNRVRRLDASTSFHTPAVVVGGADSLIMSANHVETSQENPVDFAVDAARAAVVGNVTNGQIIVGGAALSSTWAPINVVLP